MAKQGDAPEFVEEFESAAEKLAGWIAAHAWQVGGTIVFVLAAIWGFESFRGAAAEREGEASQALDATRAAYLRALGAEPGAFEVPELANPDAARAIQEEYLEAFREVAAEHRGTVAGTLALFETAAILEQLGQGDQTAGVWQEALAEAAGNPTLEGLLHQRVAGAHEEAGAWAEAAAAYEAAAALEDFPLRYWAMVDAARCRHAAGQSDQALVLYERVDLEAPDLPLPDHVRAEMRDLRAGR
ncbi:MAG: hypothetical protein QNK04_12295 [Myxococcota bacterium]|nr:hypothetical protein [Myxococcota bacterium]